MKRFLSLLATGALALGLSTSVSAQVTRGIGAGAIILDDHTNSTPLHLITIETPQVTVPPNAEYTAWQLAGFPNLVWTAPVPPTTGAQAGFVYPGPTSPSTVTPYFAYWLPPGATSVGAPGNTNTGGYAGAWDYGTAAQLGLVSEVGLANDDIPKYEAGVLVPSGFTDNGTNVTVTTEGLIAGGNVNLGSGLGTTNEFGNGASATNQFGSGGSASNNFGSGATENQIGQLAVRNDFGEGATANYFGQSAGASNATNYFGTADGTGTATNQIGSAILGATANTTIGGGAGTSSVAITSGTNWNITGAGAITTVGAVTLSSLTNSSVVMTNG